MSQDPERGPVRVWERNMSEYVGLRGLWDIQLEILSRKLNVSVWSSDECSEMEVYFWKSSVCRGQLKLWAWMNTCIEYWVRMRKQHENKPWETPAEEDEPAKECKKPSDSIKSVGRKPGDMVCGSLGQKLDERPRCQMLLKVQPGWGLQVSVGVNDTGVMLTLEGAVTEVCWEWKQDWKELKSETQVRKWQLWEKTALSRSSWCQVRKDSVFKLGDSGSHWGTTDYMEEKMDQQWLKKDS